MSSRDFDIVLLGASGSVGNVMAQYLVANSSAKWAIAGRAASSHKLTKLLALCQGKNPPSLITADVSDEASLLAMASRTRIVVTTVGPYADYGEAVVRACIDKGAHYVDITGEAFWVAEMRDAYGARAQAAGVCIVSFAGYDCVPFELSAYLAHQQLAKAHGTRLVSCESLTTTTGGPPKGTILTCLGMPGLGLLRVNRMWLQYVPPSERLAFVRDAVLWALPWWSAQAGGLTLPDLMGAVASTIVHVSAPKLGYPKVLYNSRFDVTGSTVAFCGGGQAVFGLLFFFGLLPVLSFYVLAVPLMAVGGAIFGPLLLLPPTRNFLLGLISKHLNYPGNPESHVLVRTRGVGAGGEIARVTLDLPGDPGIYATATCAAETALAMLDTKGGLPAGFTTPVHACGEALAKRIGNVKGATVHVE